MTKYEFTFVASGVDPEADDFEDRFYEAGCDDATLALIKGCVVACFVRDAEDYTHAVHSSYCDVLRAGAKIERFEPDYLVSANDIANRSNMTRSAISLFAKQERGEGFPVPIVRVTTDSPLWDWVEVSHWLHQRGRLEPSVVAHAKIGRAVNRFVFNNDAVTGSEKIFMDSIAKAEIASRFLVDQHA